MAITLKIYQNENRKEPFTEWLEGIGDRRTDARIRQRLRRIQQYGDFRQPRSLGDHRRLRGVDLSEFRIDFGPGYRIYWNRIDENAILLLRGGIRAHQNQDIQNAIADWGKHQQRRLEPSDYSDFT